MAKIVDESPENKIRQVTPVIPGPQGLIAVDGQVTVAEDAVISPLDRGFMYGDAVFEVLVAFGEIILNLSEHLQRLRESALAICMEIPWSDQELAFEMQGLLATLNVAKSNLRLVVTRGLGQGISLPINASREEFGRNPPARKVIYARPATVESSHIYSEGLRLMHRISTHSRRGSLPKTPYYLPGIVALNRAQGSEPVRKCDDILWCREDGELTEATTANIFLLARQGDLLEIVTPPEHSGLLLGITRQEIMRLLRQAKIPVQEQVVYAEEIPRFDEAFLTSTVRGLVPIQSIDRHKLHTARQGAAFRHIQRLYMTWVQTQIGYQVDWASGAPIATP